MQTWWERKRFWSSDRHKFIYPGVDTEVMLSKRCESDIKTASNCYDLKYLQAVEEVNELKIWCFLKKLKTFGEEPYRNDLFAIWGLSFKPNTDDMARSSCWGNFVNLELLVAEVKATIPLRWRKLGKSLYFDKVTICKVRMSLVDAECTFLLVNWMVWIPEFSWDVVR